MLIFSEAIQKLEIPRAEPRKKHTALWGERDNVADMQEARVCTCEEIKIVEDIDIGEKMVNKLRYEQKINDKKKK